MRTLGVEQMDELWERYWREMDREWFKIEVLQDYSVEDDSPSLRAWLKGDREKSMKLLETDDDPEFTEDCRQKISQGVRLTRIHVLQEPLSAYMQWELEYYKRVSMPLRGENVLIVYSKNTQDLNLPAGDLILFDGRRAIENAYAANGRLVQARFYDEQDDISAFLVLRNELKKRARPAGEWPAQASR